MSEEVNVTDLERAVYAQEYEQASLRLTKVLQQLERGVFKPSPQDMEHPDGDRVLRIYTVVACAIHALFADQRYQPPAHVLHLLMLQSGVIEQVLLLSGFREGNLWYLLNRAPAGMPINMSLPDFAKGLVIASSQALGDDALAAAIKLPPTEIAAFVMGRFCNQLALSAASEHLRNGLVHLAPLIERAEFHDLMVERAGVAWMYCTYADHPQKHDIKRAINAAFLRWVENKGIRLAELPKNRPERDKPLLVIVMERAASAHAMMRCYRGSIESLRRRFRTVAFVDERYVDDEGQQAFDKVILADPRPAAFKELVQQIVQLRPDAIYYPSLGMSPFAVWLANLRLAPVQFMSPGHPATSMSTQMDYAIVAGGMNFDPATFSERVVELASAGANFDPFSTDGFPDPEIRERPDTIRVAIAARLFKLTHSLLKVLAEIRSRSTRPLEFHFFPNEIGTLYLAARREIRSQLPGAIVHPSCAYSRYLDNLKSCDIALGPLVFGNTNSAVDASLLAIPMVAMDGPEFHTGTEEQVMRLVGLPRWLITYSQEEYIQAALRLIENDDERVALSRALIGKVQQEIYGNEHERNDFATTVEWLYEHHDEVQASNLRCIRPHHRLPQ